MTRYYDSNYEVVVGSAKEVSDRVALLFSNRSGWELHGPLMISTSPHGGITYVIQAIVQKSIVSVSPPL